MTAETLGKTVLFGANTPMHGIVALMLEHIKMLFAHQGGIFDALLSLSCGDRGEGSPSLTLSTSL